MELRDNKMRVRGRRYVEDTHCHYDIAWALLDLDWEEPETFIQQWRSVHFGPKGLLASASRGLCGGSLTMSVAAQRVEWAVGP